MKRLPPQIIFQSDHLAHGLRQRTFRGGTVSMAAQGIRFSLGLLGTMVLARILTPSDFGLFGMVMVVIGFVGMFRDAGMSTVTVQTDRISHDQISAVFWLGMFINCLLGACVLASAPLVATFYGRPELAAVTAALSTSFFLSGLGIQHRALLQRHMMIRELAICMIGSQVVALAVTICLASLGWRYWALVAGSLSQVLVENMLSLFFCPWIPGKIRKDSGSLRMLKFGGHLTLAQVGRYVSTNMDNLLIGGFLGATSLGFYSKAYQSLTIPMALLGASITQIGVPVLSAIHSQPDRYRRYYQQLLDILASLTFPAALYCVLEAGFVIQVFLGSQWLEAVGVFRLLAIGALIHPVAATQGLVLISVGASRRFLAWNMFTAIATVTAFVAGLPFGIEGVAAAHAIAAYVILIPSLFYCFSRTPMTVYLFFRTLIQPFVASVLAVTGALLYRLVSAGNSTVEHIAFAIIFIIIYAAASCYRQSVRTILRQYYSFMASSEDVEGLPNGAKHNR